MKIIARITLLFINFAVENQKHEDFYQHVCFHKRLTRYF